MCDAQARVERRPKKHLTPVIVYVLFDVQVRSLVHVLESSWYGFTLGMSVVDYRSGSHVLLLPCRASPR
jgi:hypothetical protein